MKLEYKDDPFFQFPRTSVTTDMGKVELPIYFFDVDNLIAIFKADKQGVDQLLKGTGLKSALSLGGSPLVFISLYEYRETSVGAYNEVEIAIPVVQKSARKPKYSFIDLLRPTDKAQIGWHIINLPVTTERANAAGREIWGYPKFVTQIPFKLGHASFSAEVKDPVHGSIMHLCGKLNLGIKAPTLSGITYSHVNNKILRAAVNVRGKYKAYLAHQLKLTIGDSQHVMAKNLRTLGLSGARPILALASNDFQSRLNTGAEIS